MGSAPSKVSKPNPVAPSAATYADVSRSMQEYFGITSSAAVYLTGIDALTLPTAFIAGMVVGGGISLWRAQPHWRRPALGAGTFLCGLTLAVPPYVRLLYAPWLFISPVGLTWAGFTGMIIGVGVRLLRQPRVPVADEEDIDLTGAASGSALIACGVYLACPGALRLAFMYGS